MKRIKKFIKYLKSAIKKSCRLVPKVVIDLPFEGRKVEGSWKYRGRERVPKVGSRSEETITEPINSRIGEFHFIVCLRGLFLHPVLKKVGSFYFLCYDLL